MYPLGCCIFIGGLERLHMKTNKLEGEKNQIDKILTPKVMAKINLAREEAFERITNELSDYDEDFLDRIGDWIDDYVAESYERGDAS